MYLSSTPGCYDHCVYFLHIKDGDVHFKFKTGGEVKSSPVADVQSSLVFIGSHDHHLYALSPEVTLAFFICHALDRHNSADTQIDILTIKSVKSLCGGREFFCWYRIEYNSQVYSNEDIAMLVGFVGPTHCKVETWFCMRQDKSDKWLGR